MDFSIEIPFVSEHHTAMIFPLDIIQIMEVVNIDGSHVVRVDYTAYSTYSMEFISIIVETLRCTITPLWSTFIIIPAHCAAFSSGIMAAFYRLGAV